MTNTAAGEVVGATTVALHVGQHVVILGVEAEDLDCGVHGAPTHDGGQDESEK